MTNIKNLVFELIDFVNQNQDELDTDEIDLIDKAKDVIDDFE